VTHMLHDGQLSQGNHSFRLTPSTAGVQWVVLRDAESRVLDARMISGL
jgi:hypothetical protein